MEMESNWVNPRSLLIAVGIALSLFATGCSTTVESQPEAAKAVESGGAVTSVGDELSRSRRFQAGARTKGWRGLGLDKPERTMGELQQNLAGSCSVLGSSRFQSFNV